MLPSLATSVASACSACQHVNFERSGDRSLAIGTHQLQNTLGGGLLVGVLGEEEQALASLARPSDGLVGVLALLATKVAAEAVLGNGGLLAEPEVLLRESEAPAMR